MTHTHMAVHQNPQHPVAIPALFRSRLNHIDSQSPEFQRMVTSSTSKVGGSKTFSPQKKKHHLNSSSGSLPFSPPPPGRKRWSLSRPSTASMAVKVSPCRRISPVRGERSSGSVRMAMPSAVTCGTTVTTGQPSRAERIGGPVKFVEFTRKWGGILINIWLYYIYIYP